MVGRWAHFGPRIRGTPLRFCSGPSSGAVGRREKAVIIFVRGDAQIVLTIELEEVSECETGHEQTLSENSGAESM